MNCSAGSLFLLGAPISHYLPRYLFIVFKLSPYIYTSTDLGQNILTYRMYNIQQYIIIKPQLIARYPVGRERA